MDRDDTPCPWCHEPSGHVARHAMPGKLLSCVSCGRLIEREEIELYDGAFKFARAAKT